MALVVSPKQSPFPYAATAIAAFTGKVAVEFDDTVPSATLTVNSSTVTDEDAIIQSIATENGLASDSDKVGHDYNVGRRRCP